MRRTVRFVSLVLAVMMMAASLPAEAAAAGLQKPQGGGRAVKSSE